MTAAHRHSALGPQPKGSQGQAPTFSLSHSPPVIALEHFSSGSLGARCRRKEGGFTEGKQCSFLPPVLHGGLRPEVPLAARVPWEFSGVSSSHCPSLKSSLHTSPQLINPLLFFLVEEPISTVLSSCVRLRASPGNSVTRVPRTKGERRWAQWECTVKRCHRGRLRGCRERCRANGEQTSYTRRKAKALLTEKENETRMKLMRRREKETRSISEFAR